MKRSKPWRPLNGRGETTYSKHTQSPRATRGGHPLVWGLVYPLVHLEEVHTAIEAAQLYKVVEPPVVETHWLSIDFVACAIDACVVVSTHGTLGNSTLGK